MPYAASNDTIPEPEEGRPYWERSAHGQPTVVRDGMQLESRLNAARALHPAWPLRRTGMGGGDLLAGGVKASGSAQ